MHPHLKLCRLALLRERAALLEQAITDACEAAARRVSPDAPRHRWDRHAWQHYLAEGDRHAARHARRLNRIHHEIAALEAEAPASLGVA